MSELERRKRKEGERTGNPYLYFSLGIGFVIAAVLIIVTSGTAAAGLGFVSPLLLSSERAHPTCGGSNEPSPRL